MPSLSELPKLQYVYSENLSTILNRQSYPQTPEGVKRGLAEELLGKSNGYTNIWVVTRRLYCRRLPGACLAAKTDLFDGC